MIETLLHLYSLLEWRKNRSQQDAYIKKGCHLLRDLHNSYSNIAEPIEPSQNNRTVSDILGKFLMLNLMMVFLLLV